MGKKVEKRCDRLELADYLADLSQQLRRGQVEAEGGLWTVPERVEVKIHYEEEDGGLVTKLSWRWAKPAKAPGVQGPAAPQGQASFKEVKVRLAAGFKELQRSIAEGLIPEAKAIADFVEGSRAFAVLAKAEWRNPMAAYMTHLENLQSAAARGEFEAVQRELRELTNSMTSCHREFK